LTRMWVQDPLPGVYILNDFNDTARLEHDPDILS
jgi:hypothetical protein